MGAERPVSNKKNRGRFFLQYSQNFEKNEIRSRPPRFGSTQLTRRNEEVFREIQHLGSTSIFDNESLGECLEASPLSDDAPRSPRARGRWSARAETGRWPGSGHSPAPGAGDCKPCPGATAERCVWHPAATSPASRASGIGHSCCQGRLPHGPRRSSKTPPHWGRTPSGIRWVPRFAQPLR